MLMAAGLGTRLRPFTDLEPKPLLPVMGVPMAQFAVDSLVAAGVREIVANVHHLAPRARAGLASLDFSLGGAASEAANLRLSDESAKLLGSVGGLRHALPLLGDDAFFLVNSDTLGDVDLAALARTHRRLRARWGVRLTLTVFPRAPGEGRYREILCDPAAGLVTGLGEVASNRPLFVGAAVIEPEAVAHLPDDTELEFVPEILRPAIADGKAGLHLAEGAWHDIGSPELWLEAHLAMLDGLETGRLPAAWRRRIEARNRRVGERAWVSASAPRRGLRTTAWSAPCYWDPLGEHRGIAPESLGPRAILYGCPAFGSDGREPAGGIGYQGKWVNATRR